MSDVIKLELLKLAKDILIEQMLSERTKLENDWNAQWNKQENGRVEMPPFPEISTIKCKDVVKAARLLDIEMLDHLVVGKDGYTSIRSNIPGMWEQSYQEEI